MRYALRISNIAILIILLMTPSGRKFAPIYIGVPIIMFLLVLAWLARPQSPPADDEQNEL